MDYPINQVQELALKIQNLHAEYRSEGRRALDFDISFEERSRMSTDASNNFMKNAGTKVLPDIQKTLAEITALLDAEDKAIAERIQPILTEAQRIADHPVNPLGYTKLSSLLMSLAGQLPIRVVAKPTVFVGYRYTEEDEKIANKFIELFRLENLNPISGKTAKAEDVDDKVKGRIAQSEGVIIILTKEQELKNGGWTTSTWLTDEKAFGLGRDILVILLYEDCIAPSERKGIHGALEYIEFNREHLDEAFLKAIPYLRDFRQRILESSR